jgi:hypothetical protein
VGGVICVLSNYESNLSIFNKNMAIKAILNHLTKKVKVMLIVQSQTLIIKHVGFAIIVSLSKRESND